MCHGLARRHRVPPRFLMRPLLNGDTLSDEPMSAETCYMCAELATSREHVPPKCISPEQKDVGRDFRENLITVPSCREHNGRKSRDDEFLLVCLAGIIGNNSIGYRHKFSKVD